MERIRKYFLKGVLIMKDITKKLIMGASGIGAMALVGALLGRKDKTVEEPVDDNEVEIDEDLFQDSNYDEPITDVDENVEE